MIIILLKGVHMVKKETAISVFIILLIFFIGFLLRVESVHLNGVSSEKKAFYEGSDGLPYMYELDSYYNYRLTRNFLDHGYIGDTYLSGREWDLHSYYPPGVPMDYPPLIVYITAFFYKIINFFVKMPLLSVCFWIPAFIGPLSGVVAFLFVRRFTNIYGAAAAGILMVTAPFYLTRTVPGWFDTDMFNVLFPLLITWLFIEGVHIRNNSKKGILLALLAAFSMFLFSLAWNGWQYFFYLTLIFSLIYLIWCKFKGKKTKKYIYVIGTFFLGTIILLEIFTGFVNIIRLVSGPFEFIKLYGNTNPWGSWPDVYSTVSELQIPSIREVISGVGIAFFGGLLGLLWILRILINKNLKHRFLNNMSWFFYLFLVVWTITDFFALIKGARFIILLIPPMVISTGIMVGIVVEYLALLKENKKFRILEKREYLTLISIAILIWLSIPAILSVHESTSGLVPLANDDMWDVSVWIKNNTVNGTVIISDWSYGHFFTAIADRPVSLDGRMGYIETMPVRFYDPGYTFKDMSPNISRDYWINRAFSTSNENLSEGIFRMLSTSGDLAFLAVNHNTKNTSVTVKILNEILGVDRNTAKTILIEKYNFDQQNVENILNFTHPYKSGPFVLVTSDSMINRGKNIFRVGEWDFNKVERVNYTYLVHNYKITNEVLKAKGIYFNMKTGEINWKGKLPYCLMIISNNNISKRYLDSKSNFCLIILRDNKKVVVIDKRFENSLFTKLVIEKINTTEFNSIYSTKSVMVWKSKSSG
jgi:dolichyl-phosphooligosaccharide-protein glycotransferase